MPCFDRWKSARTVKFNTCTSVLMLKITFITVIIIERFYCWFYDALKNLSRKEQAHALRVVFDCRRFVSWQYVSEGSFSSFSAVHTLPEVEIWFGYFCYLVLVYCTIIKVTKYIFHQNHKINYSYYNIEILNKYTKLNNNNNIKYLKIINIILH